MPERIRPFFNSLCAARVGLPEVTGIDATFGEVLVGFATAGISGLRNQPSQGEWIDEDQVKAFIAQGRPFIMGAVWMTESN